MTVKPSIEICVPNRESTADMSAELSKTLQSLKAPDTEKNYRINVNYSYQQPVDANRNQMVKTFLDKPNAEWLLMIDADCCPQRDILKMVERDKPVVSAITAISKGGVPRPVVLKNENGNYRVMGINEFYEKTQEKEVVNVDGVGTGCLLIKREVLENIEPPWFSFVYNEHGGLELGEDFYFSKKVQQNGFDMYIDTKQLCSHFRKTDLLEVLRIISEEKRKSVQNFCKENGLEEYLENERTI